MPDVDLKMTRNTTPPSVRPRAATTGGPSPDGRMTVQLTPEELAAVSAENTPDTNTEQPTHTVPQDKTMAAMREELNVPAGYIPVNLSSAGRLGIPPVVHVRDYIGSDALKMARMNGDNQLEIMCAVVQGMLYEKIDVFDLHEEDMKEILLNVHGVFWGPELKNYLYPINEEEFSLLPEEKRKRIEQGLEYPMIDLELSRIETFPIAEDAVEPITLTLSSQNGSQTSVSFMLPRVGHEVYANRYASQKYSYQEEKFSKIAAQLKVAERQKYLGAEDTTSAQINPEEREAYHKYVAERESFTTAIKQAQQIISFNGKKCETIDEKLKAYEQISVQFWSQLRSVIEKKFSFGINDMAKLISPYTGEEVLRNCRFQYLDFVPSDRLDGANEFIVTLGK